MADTPIAALVEVVEQLRAMTSVLAELTASLAEERATQTPPGGGGGAHLRLRNSAMSSSS
jgi:hypothetical protein